MAADPAKSLSAVDALRQLLGRLPADSSDAASLLHDADVAAEITARLRQPLSGAGDDNLCRWLYDTFHTSDPGLQLVVLRFLPTLCGVYLLRAAARRPLPGFEAVLLALYAHETKARAGQAVTVTIPDIGHPSLYHETTRTAGKNNATEVHIAVVSASLEPHGTVRATKRARIVGVALELYYSKISLMPVGSKLAFCHFCKLWSGYDLDDKEEDGDPIPVKSKEDGASTSETPLKEAQGEEVGRIPLPWELQQPSLRILAHSLLGPMSPSSLKEAAFSAIRSMHRRALHDMSPQAILATDSLLKIGTRELENAIDELSCSSSMADPEPERLVITTFGSDASSPGISA